MHWGDGAHAQGSHHACRLSQVVVVLSGSMEPGFYRGDILFLHMPQARCSFFSPCLN